MLSEGPDARCVEVLVSLPGSRGKFICHLGRLMEAVSRRGSLLGTIQKAAEPFTLHTLQELPSLRQKTAVTA